MKSIHRMAVVLAVIVVLGGCGSSKKSTTAAPPATTTTVAPTTTTQAPTTTTAAPATTTTTIAQTMTITPSTGLKDKQVVHIVGKGFTPGEKDIGVNECGDKGNNTMAGDCDLGGTKVVIPDASGTVTIDFVVKKGPFGGNNIVCSAAQACLISVSQLSATATETATQNITFG